MAKKSTRKKSATKKTSKKAGKKRTAKKTPKKKATSKKPARKKSPSSKLSPKERWGTRADLGADPSAYIDALPADLHAAGKRLHKALMTSAPGVKSSIKWGMPVYEFGQGKGMSGMFASLWKGKGYLRLGLYTGAGLPDPDNLLQGEGKGHRHVRFIPGTTPWGPVEQLIKRSAVACKNAG
ncbi:MAG: DUF1801 domain-containing protein [Phycisphaerales bacterium]